MFLESKSNQVRKEVPQLNKTFYKFNVTFTKVPNSIKTTQKFKNRTSI